MSSVDSGGGTTVRVLYIGGVSRSGSTLMERVLGQLPGVCALGEVANLWQRGLRDDEQCGCGDRFSDCQFWTDVGQLAFGGWHQVDIARFFALRYAVERSGQLWWLAARAPTDHRRALVREYAEYYRRIYQAAARLTGARVIVDSSKRALLAFCLRWSPDVDMRVLHLVRDPRGVAYSLTKRVRRLPAGTGTTALMARYSTTHAALTWNGGNLRMELLRLAGRRARAPGTGAISVHRLRYEDFLSAPRATISQLAVPLGLDVQESDLAYLGDDQAELGVLHSPSGNPMRFATGRLHLRRDDAWCTGLAPWRQRLVTALCGPMIYAYGFPLTASSAAAVDGPAASSAAEARRVARHDSA